ncbi:hypothetical protein C0Q70_03647 [Pomacea canaliculata]|uniref:Phosphatidylinositol N-acetylglucosaminyltransferase n=1 Tax=Pomacea canaliculata TaxID=400727 RepID=A0A2T7PTB2_POMCA|nr:hypothetical protein C0Q70_03647 [Pomacea canaliculata]
MDSRCTIFLYHPFTTSVFLPSLFTTLPLLRSVFLHEKISIVHGHSAFSTLGHEAMFHARTMGLKTVFTDHSLFGFADASSILTNKILKFSLADVSHVICVSNTSKENTVLRSRLSPHQVSVIPNAVDATVFVPDPSKRAPDKITVVILSRLVYRKGMDLLAGVIPLITALYPQVHFLIGGDGPKRVLLEEVREQYELHDRVTFIGSLCHSQVHEVLCQGDIMLNTSLTEAFCIAIVEAACCGLQVVSTRVGGIPEVLPPDLIYLADPNVKALAEALQHAIDDRIQGKAVPPWESHERVKHMYTWANIAARTEIVYNLVDKTPGRELGARLLRYYRCGPVAGKLFVIAALLNLLFLTVLSIIFPAQNVEAAPDLKVFAQHQHKNFSSEVPRTAAADSKKNQS